jgi:hypothetical protein
MNARRRPALAVLVLVLVGSAVLVSSRDPRLVGPLPLLGLPGDLVLCGRSYAGGSGIARSAAELAGDGVVPLVVEPWLHPTCVPGACTEVATDGPCHTVIYVPAGPDRLVAYSLRGGP